MPKFVSGSSGHIYSHDKLATQEEDEILAVISGHKSSGTTTTNVATTTTTSTSYTLNDKKPPAINKKGTKEKQKSSLDLFKEELRRLNEERDEQRNKLKDSLNTSTSSAPSTSSKLDKHQYPVKAPPVPVPLKPDPRCPTALTLQVNLNPNRDKDSSGGGGGSFDNGDPTTTNLYLGNLNPIVTENDLCDIFGKFGPLASIKIMWPRTDEERARNRNSGFVAYMSRIDAERALKTLNGMEYKNYELKLGWGKAVPLPKNPVFIPKELIEFMTRPLAQSGLPFNSQLHATDLARGYIVPKPWPRPDHDVNQEQQQHQVSPKNVKAQQDIYQEFAEVLQRSTVHVQVPQDIALLELIHTTIDCALREGPIYEAMLIARESENPEYKFLHDTNCLEHIYYRWKLYSVLHGEDPNVWRTEPFRMFDGGPMWQPPPLNPFADGMPLELVEQLTGINKQVLTSERPGGVLGLRKMQISSEPPAGSASDSLASSGGGGCLKFKGKFGPELVGQLNKMLVNLTPTRASIGAAMLFCIQHSDAADEIVQCFEVAQSSSSIAYKVRLAQLFLISDILHNSSAAVTNASFYRKGFQAKLVGMFERLRDYMQTIEDCHKADRFKQKVLSVLNAWGYFHMYESKFLLQLSNIFLNITTTSEHQYQQHNYGKEQEKAKPTGDSNLPGDTIDAQLDGEPVDEQVLAQCLEERGLSLRWYKTLDLSDDDADELDAEEARSESDAKHRSRSPATPTAQHSDDRAASEDKTTTTRFKASKWELISEEMEHKSPPARLISQPITTRAVPPVKDLSSQKVGSPDYNDNDNDDDDDDNQSPGSSVSSRSN